MDELDNFQMFDKTDAYELCVHGTTLVGASFGALSGAGAFSAPGAIAGAVVGRAIGIKACKRFAPALKEKLLSSKSSITESELSSVLKHLREENPMITKQQAIETLAEFRKSVGQYPWDFQKIV
jgi:hypothetical protein